MRAIVCHLANSLAMITREPQTRRQRTRWVGGGGENRDDCGGTNAGWMRQFCRRSHEFPNQEMGASAFLLPFCVTVNRFSFCCSPLRRCSSRSRLLQISSLGSTEFDLDMDCLQGPRSISESRTCVHMLSGRRPVESCCFYLIIGIMRRINHILNTD